MDEKSGKGADVPKALKAESTLKSSWYIVDTNGKLSPIKIKEGQISGYNFKKHPNLKKLAMYEMAKAREVKEEPAHVKYMRKLELADHEPGSDPGNIRYYPNGELIRDLIIDIVDHHTVSNYGAMKVETPIMYDLEHPTIKSYLNRFPARQYIVKSEKRDFFLRFASCFGQFLMAKDAVISHRSLPMKLYELARYAFRLEKHGELVGLRRLRSFTMPDCHAFCADMESAREEFMNRFDLVLDVQKDIGFNMSKDFELAIRVVKPFYNKNKDVVNALVKKFKKPALVEMWNKQHFYFMLKYELNIIDGLDKASALSTDQIDVENAKNYGIKFTDKDNKKKEPIILHCSPSGAIERVMYALLERAATMKVPKLPLWLEPEQVRILTISDKHDEKAVEIAEALCCEGVRVGIDDRNERVGKKVFDAKAKWIPHIVVVGDKELEGGKLQVVVRKGSTTKKDNMKKWTLNEFIKELRKELADKPFRPMYIPARMSQRPIFVAWSHDEKD
jgi:threonyl-tRNA synthetase